MNALKLSQKHYQKAALTVELQPMYLCSRLNFYLGNVVKYLCRADFKGDKLGDLHKALDYLMREHKRAITDRTGFIFDDDLVYNPWMDGKTPDFLAEFEDAAPHLSILFDPDGHINLRDLKDTAFAVACDIIDLQYPDIMDETKEEQAEELVAEATDRAVPYIVKSSSDESQC